MLVEKVLTFLVFFFFFSLQPLAFCSCKNVSNMTQFYSLVYNSQILFSCLNQGDGVDLKLRDDFTVFTFVEKHTLVFITSVYTIKYKTFVKFSFPLLLLLLHLLIRFFFIIYCFYHFFFFSLFIIFISSSFFFF